MRGFGLTGGPGMGKSTSLQLLCSRGIAVVDTDDLARQVVELGQPSLAEVERAFGREVIGPDGRLLREELARRVFSAPAARKKLEAILHPRIRELWRTQLSAWRTEERPMGVVVIPLLFETKAQAEFDATVCVACSAATQRQRLLARGWSAEQIEQRISAQWPVEEKIAKSDYVIWTEAGLDVLEAQIERVFGVIKSLGGS